MITRISKRHLISLSFIICQLSFSVMFTSCSDANEYEDADTNNLSFVNNYNDTLKINHPESLANTMWVRGSGIKQSATSGEVQGYIESLNFVSSDSVAVKMSEGTSKGTWNDESNTEKLPYYEYTYASKSGTIEILKVDKSGSKVTKTPIFQGVAVNGTQEVIVMVHHGDTPSQTYLVKQ